MQTIDPSFYQELRYRLVGPFRAGRTVGGVGVPSQPGVFLIGANNGGVWKTDDYGRTWHPIFDAAPTGSIGDVAVASSNPEVIYIGSGEGLHRPDLGVGDGIFKSTDGGRTWRHVGLSDIQQVGRIVVHPTNPDVVFVAGMGHPYGPSDERGVFSLQYASFAFREIGCALAKKQGYHTVVLTSTVLPGATRYGLLPILERCGIIAKRRGRTAVLSERTAACTSPPTAPSPGTNCRAVSPIVRRGSVASRSRLPRAIRIASTRSFPRSGTGPCIDRTMRARRGNA